MKNKDLGLVLGILTLIVATLGATLAFFNASMRGNRNVEAEAFKFNMALEVDPEYYGNKLIPMNDEDYMTAYNNKCVDYKNWGACTSYKIKLENNGDPMELIGTMNFNKEDVVRMTYALLDKNGNEYVSPTETGDGIKLSLGDSFSLNSNENTEFTLIIWLTNIEESQDEEDAGGKFDASLTYEATSGAKLVAHVNHN